MKAKREWKRKILNPEKSIRLYKVQDIVMFEMAKYLVKHHLNENIDTNLEDWSLQRIRFEDEKTEAHQEASQSLKNVLDIPIRISMKSQGILVKAEVPLKQYGKVRALLYHKRASEFLKYLRHYDVEEITYAQLKEIVAWLNGEYDKNSPFSVDEAGTLEIYGEDAFKKFLALEKHALEKGYTPKNPKKGHFNFKEGMLELAKVSEVEDHVVEKIIQYRNMCSHGGFIFESKKNLFHPNEALKSASPFEIVEDITKQIVEANKLLTEKGEVYV